jgi:hypothetical protein
VSGERDGPRLDNSPKVRPQRRSRARCCGASSSGNGRPTKVTDSAPAGKVILLSLTGLRNAAQREKSRVAKGKNSQGDIRLAVTRQVHPTKVVNAAIRVDEMPAVCAYSTGRIK